MIIAIENIYYQNRMFKPKEPLPCHDTKMVQAWLKSGVAIDTDKGVVKTTPIASVNKQDKNIKESEKEKTEKKAEEKTEEKNEEKTEEKTEEKKNLKSKIAKILTRSSSKK